MIKFSQALGTVLTYALYTLFVAPMIIEQMFQYVHNDIRQQILDILLFNVVLNCIFTYLQITGNSVYVIPTLP